MRKERIKTYALTPLGYARMMYEEKQAKLGKINGVVSVVIIIGMFAIGMLGKELLIIFLANKGINVITNKLVG